MQPLEKGQLWVMLVTSLVTAVMVLTAATVLGSVLSDRLPQVPVRPLLLLLLVLLLYPALVSPFRAFRGWGYRMDAEELHLAYGVWTETQTLVPLKRVQHLDIAQGPLERAFGVCRLVLHTAGTMHSRVVLPGLSRPTAEAMRDEIRARVRQESE